MSEWGDKLLTEADNARLRAENEKLRGRVAELEELTDGKLYIPQEWYQLATTENDKLRELCRHLYACNQYCDREDSDGGCSACPYQLLECDCGFEERLLELGVEVES